MQHVDGRTGGVDNGIAAQAVRDTTLFAHARQEHQQVAVVAVERFTNRPRNRCIQAIVGTRRPVPRFDREHATVTANDRHRGAAVAEHARDLLAVKRRRHYQHA